MTASYFCQVFGPREDTVSASICKLAYFLELRVLNDLIRSPRVIYITGLCREKCEAATAKMQNVAAEKLNPSQLLSQQKSVFILDDSFGGGKLLHQ